jgi:GNAT superfamily N-acetyltransferase
MPWSLRPATPRDAEQIASVMNEGLNSYRSFAPPHWNPPDARGELDEVRVRLDNPDVWCLLAEEDGAPAGHVAIMPARIHTHPSDEPGLGHFWQLFVSRPWWGSGLARELHAEAIREAGGRGFTAMRLYTPAEQLRARRFYEREGWTAVGEPEDPFEFGLPLLQYRRAISISV